MSRKEHETSTRLRDFSPAKISAPSIGDWLPRERLFRWLDENRERYRVIWVSAPAGSGKTYLIASYLAARELSGLWYQVDEGDADAASFVYFLGQAAERVGAPGAPLPLLMPEYAQGLSRFARNFFRALFARIERPGLVVLDNYQDVSREAALHDLLAVATSELPDDLALVVVSRGEPPASLARERVHGGFGRLAERDLRLNRNELSSLVRRYGIERFSDAALRRLEAETHGWFAGVVLLLNRAASTGTLDSGFDRSDRSVVFDYFATELFDRLDAETREFLMRTAFLRPVTVDAATELTGDPDAQGRLDRLVREHYFAVSIGDSTPAYRYHPLFEGFLRSRARTSWTAEQLAEVCRHAAGQAAAAGYTEEAVELLRDTGAWDALAELLCERAPALLAQGRYQSVTRWFESLPGEHFERDPWACLWLAMAKLYSDPPGTRETFIRVYERFRRTGDAHGQYMSWIGVVSSLLIGTDDFGSLDSWLSELDELRERHPDFPSPGIECECGVIAFCARVHRCEVYQDVEEWGDHALNMARRTNNLSLQVQVLFYRGFHELVLRDLRRVAETMRELERLSRLGSIRPVDRLRIKLLSAIYYNFTLDYERCRETVDEGLAIADESGVYVLNFMMLGQLGWQAAQAGNARMAEETLQRLDTYLDGASPWDRAMYQHIESAVLVLKGDQQGADSVRRSNLELHARIGESISGNISRFQMALVLLQQDRPDEAEEYLVGVARFAEQKNAIHMRCHCCFARALIALQREDENEIAEQLRPGFSMSSGIGRYGFFIWPPGMLARVCEAALRRGIECEAVRAFIRTYDLVPGTTSLDVEDWPWPVRICTLGRFSILVHGEPVRFPGKGQKRPLELLQALIALGGRDVGVELLWEALWPDAEGDAAARSFKTTLHRLRQLIGDSALDLSERRLSLNPQHCWVDVWALEWRLEHLERLVGGADSDLDELEAGIRRALDLYQGPFLALEAEAPWALSPRERLRGRLLVVIESIARRFGRGGDCGRARALCESGLQVHDHSEALYRGLMGCQAANGDRGAALGTYERCRDVLATGRALAPSPVTESLRCMIKDDLAVFSTDSCPICGHNP